MENDAWLHGLGVLLVKSGCLSKGCSVLVKGATGDPDRADRLIMTHELVEGVGLEAARVEINLDTIWALGRLGGLGISDNLIGLLRAAHKQAG